jgi:hypothetical protein
MLRNRANYPCRMPEATRRLLKLGCSCVRTLIRYLHFYIFNANWSTRSCGTHYHGVDHVTTSRCDIIRRGLSQGGVFWESHRTITPHGDQPSQNPSFWGRKGDIQLKLLCAHLGPGERDPTLDDKKYAFRQDTQCAMRRSGG